MKRTTLIKYTNQMLIDRIKRLCRMGEHLTKDKEIEDNETNISNTEGILVDRIILK
jgi:hypothetical protein